MIAGVDIKTGKPELYWLDHLASVNKLNYAAHGYASYFVMSTMDMYWHPDLTLEEGKELIKKCIHELKTRFMGNLPDFIVKVVSKDGIQLTKV